PWRRARRSARLHRRQPSPARPREWCMTAARKVTLGLVQMRCDRTPGKNLRRALKRVARAAGKGAQVVVLPELFLSPYFCQKKDDESASALAEPVPGPTTEALAGAAKEHGIVLVGGSLFEKAPEGRYFNTTPVFGPDGAMLGAYRKAHVP